MLHNIQLLLVNLDMQGANDLPNSVYNLACQQNPNS